MRDITELFRNKFNFLLLNKFLASSDYQLINGSFSGLKG